MVLLASVRLRSSRVLVAVRLMGRMMNGVNGFGAIFRLVTPALLGVCLWLMQDLKHDLGGLRVEVRVMSNDYLHEIAAIKDRLGQIEGRNTAMNGVRKR